MIKAIYKRKGRKYCCETDKAPGLCKKTVSLLSRAGIRYSATIFEYSAYISVRVTNLLGVQDVAAFAADQLDRAKAFVYSRSRDASPQLSLFWGAM